jgi:hypothetical protein
MGGLVFSLSSSLTISNRWIMTAPSCVSLYAVVNAVLVLNKLSGFHTISYDCAERRLVSDYKYSGKIYSLHCGVTNTVKISVEYCTDMCRILLRNLCDHLPGNVEQNMKDCTIYRTQATIWNKRNLHKSNITLYNVKGGRRRGDLHLV